MKKILVSALSLTAFLCFLHIMAIAPYYQPKYVLVILLVTCCSLFGFFAGVCWLDLGKARRNPIINWSLGSRATGVIFLLGILFSPVVAITSIFYTVRPDTIVQVRGQLYYPGEKILLSPSFRNLWANYDVVLQNDDRVWFFADVPGGRGIRVFVTANVNWDLAAAKKNLANSRANIPDVPKAASFLVATNSDSDLGSLTDMLLQEHSIAGKVPTRWRATRVEFIAKD